MKILWSFNTKLDEHELYNAIQENGQWNAIMMKKHRIYLIRPMVWMLFALAAFWLLIWFAYSQFYNTENRWIFRVLTVAYSLVTLTRCVHSIIMIMSDIQAQINNRNGYIDEMDFNIFTTDQFMLFRQHGFFKTESMNIATSTIKIVKESKSWFIWSRLDYWKVSIHPEGNLSENSKAIELFYVPKPKALVKKLNEFIEKSKEWMNISVMS